MTDQEILTEIQLALLEPPDGGASFPSEVWTRDEVLDALNSSIRSLVRSTRVLVLRTEIPVLANATSVSHPADWLATVWMSWRTLAGVRSPLPSADAFEADLALPGWETTTSVPIAYADLDRTTLTFRLIPTPIADGTVELLYAPRPAELAGANLPLPLPDELASGEKYGTLSTLLSKVGRLQDPARAVYCDQRVALVELAADLLLKGGL